MRRAITTLCFSILFLFNALSLRYTKPKEPNNVNVAEISDAQSGALKKLDSPVARSKKLSLPKENGGIYTKQQIKDWDKLILINKSYKLPTGYSPDNLVAANNYVKCQFSNTRLNQEALEKLIEMFKDAKKAGVHLILFAGWRSEQTQTLFFKRKWGHLKDMNTINSVSPPRSSEHELGLAADILGTDCMTRSATFAYSNSGKWLIENSWKYGFILRYGKAKEHITRYVFEPWHFRFLGVETAVQVQNSGLAYEEYAQKHIVQL